MKLRTYGSSPVKRVQDYEIGIEMKGFRGLIQRKGLIMSQNAGKKDHSKRTSKEISREAWSFIEFIYIYESILTTNSFPYGTF
jgi:hypothetical protein